MLDADGHWPAIAVVPPSVQEHDTLPAPGDGKAAWQSLRVAILNGAYTAKRCREWFNLHGMRYESSCGLPVSEVSPCCPGAGWSDDPSASSHTGAVCCVTVSVADVATARIACPAALAATQTLINPA